MFSFYLTYNAIQNKLFSQCSRWVEHYSLGLARMRLNKGFCVTGLQQHTAIMKPAVYITSRSGCVLTEGGSQGYYINPSQKKFCSPNDIHIILPYYYTTYVLYHIQPFLSPGHGSWSFSAPSRSSKEHLPHSLSKSCTSHHPLFRVYPCLTSNPVTASQCETILKSLKNTKTDEITFPVKIHKFYDDIFFSSNSKSNQCMFYKRSFSQKPKDCINNTIIQKMDPNLTLNYRPKCSLPCPSKIIEKLIHSRLLTYLNKHLLLDENQFGFQKSKSTESAIVGLIEKLYDAINNK